MIIFPSELCLDWWEEIGGDRTKLRFGFCKNSVNHGTLRSYQLVRRISEESKVAGFESKKRSMFFLCFRTTVVVQENVHTKTLELNIKQVMNKAIPISGESQPP